MGVDQRDQVREELDLSELGNQVHGEQGNDQLFMWSGGWAYGGNGEDNIFQFTRDAVLDGGNGDDIITDANDGGLFNETITMTGGNGDDELVSLDGTSTVTMDGGRGADTCSGGATTSNCEG